MQTSKVELNISVCNMMHNVVSVFGFTEGKQRFIADLEAKIETARRIDKREFDLRLGCDSNE